MRVRRVCVTGTLKGHDAFGTLAYSLPALAAAAGCGARRGCKRKVMTDDSVSVEPVEDSESVGHTGACDRHQPETAVKKQRGLD